MSRTNMIDETLMQLIKTQDPEEHEILVEKDAQLALQILNTHSGSTKEDAFLMMASANLINAYVKQVKDPHDEFSYDFKRRVLELVEQWSKTPMEGVKISRFKEVTYVEIDPLQFSFHHLGSRTFDCAVADCGSLGPAETATVCATDPAQCDPKL